jgi:hypothetical protein
VEDRLALGRRLGSCWVSWPTPTSGVGDIWP